MKTLETQKVYTIRLIGIASVITTYISLNKQETELLLEVKESLDSATGGLVPRLEITEGMKAQ